MGWGAPEDRPIPDDLEIALTELGAVRNVLVHRAGRIDAQALRSWPEVSDDRDGPNLARWRDYVRVTA